MNVRIFILPIVVTLIALLSLFIYLRVDPDSVKLAENDEEVFSLYMEELEQLTGVSYGKAKGWNLRILEFIGAPPKIVSFYAAYNPEDMIEGSVRFHTLAHVLEENFLLFPGMALRKKGYIVFATTLCGDAYCFDLEDLDENGWPRVVLHSVDTDYREYSRAEIETVAKPIAENLSHFLKLLLTDRVDQECLYFP